MEGVAVEVEVEVEVGVEVGVEVEVEAARVSLIQQAVALKELDAPKRLALVHRALLGSTAESSITQEEKTSLLFAKTLLSDMPVTAKTQYLLDSESMPWLLEKWFPSNDPRACLKWYGVAGASLKVKNATVQEIIKGARLLGQCEASIWSLVNSSGAPHLEDPHLSLVQALFAMLQWCHQSLAAESHGVHCHSVASE